MTNKFAWTFISGMFLATMAYAAALQIAPRNADGDACEMPLDQDGRTHVVRD